MKVMFDLSAFSDLVERQALEDRMASGKRVIAYASFTFLEELASLRKKDERLHPAAQLLHRGRDSKPETKSVACCFMRIQEDT